ncbi:TIMELESS-interacting protein isoform X2 [Punica granatum]|uniref:TIMELESS-interacting protein isoform X2 n=1 Tax=Punica granatum TaxID=22663 RepID=A0A6P8BND9_PUNGR|nr:TIMELESS-interacting protein isoform X2 [Punica granatum]
METGGRAAPTGCYKCGRPGHWSRDCPSDPIRSPSSGNPPPASSSASTFRAPVTASNGNFEEKSASKPKKLPRSRPKLTPELLLSDDGLGYVLRHFPRNFKYRGRGHEVSDLGNLIGMYREWHSHLLPYYSFDQFVHKVEKVAATNQVKRCIRELRDRVAHGGDPTKLHEPPTEDDIPNNDQATNMEEPNQHDKDSPFENHTVDDMQEGIFNEIFEQAIEDPSPSLPNDIVAAVVPPAQSPMEATPHQSSGNVAGLPDATLVPPEQNTVETTPHQSSGNVAGPPNTTHMSEEWKARMEANRLKALERAASRARQLQAA